MIKALKFLSSTNTDSTREVEVTAEGNSEPTNSEVKFTICDKTYTQTVALAADESKTLSQAHDRSGECLVRAEDVNGDASTEKWLDLDKESDS